MKHVGTSVDKFFNVSISLLLPFTVIDRTRSLFLATHGEWSYRGRPQVGNRDARSSAKPRQDHRRRARLRRHLDANNSAYRICALEKC